MNVIDMSGSMSYGWQVDPNHQDPCDTNGNDPCKIASAKSILIDFNNSLDIPLGDRVGLTTFPGPTQYLTNSAKYALDCNPGSQSNELYLGKLRHGLTNNIATVNATIQGLNAAGYTPIADGVRRGREALLAAHVNGKTPVLILATDGMANVKPGTNTGDPVNGRRTGFDGYNPTSPACNAPAHDGAINQAQLTKDAGVIVAGIAMGQEFNSAALQGMSTPGFFFQTTSQAELAAAFEAIRTTASTTVIGEVCQCPSGGPGANARIKLDDGQGHIFTTIADAAGHYTLYNIPNGTYTARGSGVYDGATYNVTTNGVGGAPTTVTINLQGNATQNVFLTTSVPVCTAP
jgi:hypothetical protein